MTQQGLITLLSQPACLHPEWYHHPPPRHTLTAHDIMAPCALTVSHSSQAYKTVTTIQTVKYFGNYTGFGNFGPFTFFLSEAQEALVNYVILLSQ